MRGAGAGEMTTEEILALDPPVRIGASAGDPRRQQRPARHLHRGPALAFLVARAAQRSPPSAGRSFSTP